MQTPLQITFREMELSAAVEAYVRVHVTRLERLYDRITGCHVVIDAPVTHLHKGAPFAIKIDLGVPGRKFCVNSEGAERSDHADIYVAIRDAFDSVRRLLQDHAHERTGDIKQRALPLLGTVIEFYPEENFGRIAADDGQLIYFHRNSVHSAEFDNLNVGAIAEYEEEQGDKGIQASTVWLWRAARTKRPSSINPAKHWPKHWPRH